MEEANLRTRQAIDQTTVREVDLETRQAIDQIGLSDRAKRLIDRYLNSKPIHPMEAYALGVQSKYKSAAGDTEQAQELIKRAKSLDPYFSKATGAPDPDQFIPPTKISQNHRYLMRPF